MKRILITGADSYIGTSVEKWMSRYANKYTIKTIDMIGDAWREQSFSGYDCVFHVAGIAHVSSDPKKKDLYFKINRDLAIETAEKAKSEGVKQFIFMSSIIVYGDSNRLIDTDTLPKPSNFYGESKLQAEEGIRALESDDFRIVILRPPMIYGRGAKGNYPRLSNLAKKTPVFPDMNNKRSMLHIDNLCEFVKLMIDQEEYGLFFPQNKEYVNTSDMVRLIGETCGRQIRLTKIFNPIIRMLFGIGMVNKVFGDLVYEMSMSDYAGVDYRIRDFRESIALTEK